MRVAIIGSGISGLMCAHVLSRQHSVTLFEADDRLGGHTNTVSINVGSEQHQVDTGFIVYNERNYPAFSKLLAELGVATQASDMSFSVTDRHGGLEWAGTSLNGIFAQRRNLTNARFLRMMVDIARFNRVARTHLSQPDDPAFTLGDLLATRRWSDEFLDDYLIPLGAAIWSANPQTFTEFPATTFLRFCDNHGLLNYRDRPPWRTVTGGAARYVDALTAPLASSLRLATPIERVVRDGDCVRLHTRSHEAFDFDHVVLATHSDQALRLLAAPTAVETDVLGAIRYQPNRATLHTDTSLMPTTHRAWASWNYLRPDDEHGDMTLTYFMNRLQSIHSRASIFVTLNGTHRVDPAKIHAEFSYAHPIYDEAAIRAQRRQRELCTDRISYCGAYWGNGFHEDGVQSALRVCTWLGAKW